MAITNPGWAGYFDRSYDQLKANILTNFQSLVPEITDHTETNPWVKGISIWSAIAEMLGYYIDNNAREYFLPVAREFSSAVKLAKAYNYRVKGATPASVVLRFFSNIPATGNINIPIGTKCKTTNGEVFTTTAAGIILMGTTYIDVPAKQWEAVLNIALGNSDGTADQIFVLEEDVADGSVSVKVDVITYTAQDTFFLSVSTDTHFVAGLQEDTKMMIEFGDDINGKIPAAGLAVIASYYVTLGDGGRVGAGKITTIVSVISVPGSEIITVSNAAQATGGSPYEGLSKLQKRVPLSIRTKYRAVTYQDFIDLAELVGGVERSGVDFDCDLSEFVNIYIVPDGGGLASAPLLVDVYDFISIRDIINIRILVQPSGVLNLILNADVNALPGFSNSAVMADVKTAILNFFLPSNQEIKGRVILGDLYQVIEGVTGVNYSNITLILPIPYAQNLTTPSNVLNWTRAIQPGSVSTSKWLIRFITISQFELYKDEDFMGSFPVDTDIIETEINFHVTGNHVAGDNYQFYTYAYNNSVLIMEPSIAATELGNLTINVSGGVV